MLVVCFQVQAKVNMKYDTWHKEILSKFASRLGDNMSEFYGSVSKVRTLLRFFVPDKTKQHHQCETADAPLCTRNGFYQLGEETGKGSGGGVH